MNQFEIESDESGFVLTVATTGGDLHRFSIPDGEAFYDHVRAAIWPWLYEREQAFAEFKAARAAGVFACVPDESGGYDLSDPKHPRYHSIHADLWDMREKNPDEYEYLRTEAKREAAGE